MIQGLLNNSLQKQLKAPEELRTDNGRECSKKHALSLSKGLSSKAAAILTRGAYILYVSTAKGRPAYAKPLSAFVAHFGEVGSAGMEPLACQP